MNNPQFQSRMNLTPALGLAGQVAGNNPVIYAIKQAKSANNLTIGNFTWYDKSLSEAEGTLTVNSTGTEQVFGIVAHTATYFNTNTQSGASMTISTGDYADIIRKGDIYVNSINASTYGDKVFANLDDGAIIVGQAGATIENAIETDFTVVEGGDAGTNIIISNWI